MREQVEGVRDRLGELDASPAERDSVAELADSISSRLTAVETELLQTKAESGQDPINYESQLSGYFAHLASSVRSADARPTDGARQRYADLVDQLEAQREGLRRVLETDVPRLNGELREHGFPAVGGGTTGSP